MNLWFKSNIPYFENVDHFTQVEKLACRIINQIHKYNHMESSDYDSDTSTLLHPKIIHPHNVILFKLVARLIFYSKTILTCTYSKKDLLLI